MPTKFNETQQTSEAHIFGQRKTPTHTQKKKNTKKNVNFRNNKRKRKVL
jgi:hypothetical protein